jgi:hypothetical protein
MPNSRGFAGLNPKKTTAAVLTITSILALAARAGFAAGLTVGPGASFGLGGGSVILNCLDLTVSGQFFAADGRVEAGRDVSVVTGGSLDGGNSEIRLSGDWANAGAFNPGSGSVRIEDGCGRNTSALIGNSTFFSFEATTASGRTLRPAANSTQVFQDNLVLAGTPGNELKIRSSSPGNWAFFTLEPGATQLIQRVDVMDNNASQGQLLAPGAPLASNSINSGNVLNWFDILSAINEIFSDGFEARN